jgi:adenylate cyclase
VQERRTSIPIEIERKFLVADASWRNDALQRQHVRQVYFTTEDHMSVRVRIGDFAHATLTVKLPRSGITGFEFKQELSLHEALTLVDLASSEVVEKNRYTLEHAEHIWEIGSYLRANCGLAVAEIELQHETESFDYPPWLGKEITGVER